MIEGGSGKGDPILDHPHSFRRVTITDELFSPYITHIEVRCWECGHTVVRRPGDVPIGITQHEFERRAVCKCGTGWPQVSRFPKKPSTTMG